jgi:hypothetical protein
MPGEPHDDRPEDQPQSGRGRQSSLFAGGGLFVREFTLPTGTIALTATVLIRGTKLELWDAEFFPVGRSHMLLGVVGIRKLIDELCALAHAEGLDIVRLSGYRIGGSSPGRASDIPIVCRDR